jgi:hypothetical protein
MNFRKGLLLAAMIIAVVASSAYAHEYKLGDLVIDHPWSRATPPAAKTGAGYMTILNKGTTADRLIAISSAAAGRVEVHRMTMDGTIMRMRPVPEGVEIGPGESVKLEPGGYHLMMMDLREPLKQGQKVPVTLRFERAGQVTVDLAVEAMGAGATGAGHDGHGQQN